MCLLCKTAVPNDFSCLGTINKQETQCPSFSLFLWQVTTANGDVGIIEGSFGKSGKFKVQFPKGISVPASGSNAIQLTFKKIVFDKDKRHMAQ